MSVHAARVKKAWQRARAWSCALADSPIAVLQILAAAQLAQLSSSWMPTRDGAAYISIAKSISSGSGLLRFGDPHLHFAPGYPALIAPAFLFLDQPFLLVSFFHWLFSIVFLVGTYLWLRRQIPEHALLLTALSAINVSVLYYFRRTLSEAAFMPLLMWCAVFMDRAIDNAHNVRGMKYAVLAALVGGYLCTVRLAGAALACGFALTLVSKVTAQQIAAARAALYACLGIGLPLAAALWLVFYDRAMSAADGQTASYYDALTRHGLQLHEQIFTGIGLRIQETGRLLIPGAFKIYGGWLNPMMLLYLPLFAAVLAGWYRMLRRSPTPLILALPFYLALYIVWPHDQGTRFLTPMVPLLWLCFATFAVERWPRQAARFAPLLVLACALTSLTYLIADRLEARKLTRYWRLTDAMSTVIHPPARIGFIRTSDSFSGTAFGIICTVQFDRRCEEITDPTNLSISPKIEYIAVLGPSLALSAFSPVLRREELTVLHRAQPSSNRSALPNEPSESSGDRNGQN